MNSNEARAYLEAHLQWLMDYCPAGLQGHCDDCTDEGSIACDEVEALAEAIGRVLESELFGQMGLFPGIEKEGK